MAFIGHEHRRAGADRFADLCKTCGHDAVGRRSRATTSSAPSRDLPQAAEALELVCGVQVLEGHALVKADLGRSFSHVDDAADSLDSAAAGHDDPADPRGALR